MQEALKRLVWERAANRCEYCRLPFAAAYAGFEIDHIIAIKHRGATVGDNLALSCVYCNESKGSNIAGIDALSGEIIRLFHPRRDTWSEHFEWDGPYLLGKTPQGRATIEVLTINRPMYILLRELLIEEGYFKNE